MMHTSFANLSGAVRPWLLCAALSLSAGAITQAQPLVNLGLVGVGRLPGDAFDQLGAGVDTLGGIFSGMWLDPATLAHSNGTIRATVFGLPDRGFGDGLQDYHPRVQRLEVANTPYYGPGPVRHRCELHRHGRRQLRRGHLLRLRAAVRLGLPEGRQHGDLHSDGQRRQHQHGLVQSHRRGRRSPQIIGVSPSRDQLWPPNQKLEPVTLTLNVSENCSTPVCERMARREERTLPPGL